MGTNYYLTNTYCKCCKRSREECTSEHWLKRETLLSTPEVKLHIGKSSGGWCFSLHVIPSLGLNTLDDWELLIDEALDRAKWEEALDRVVKWHIIDEYGDLIGKTELHNIITKRVERYASARLDDDLKRIITKNRELCGREDPKQCTDDQYLRIQYGYPAYAQLVFFKDTLIRHYFDGVHCVGHGEGSWDYITGEFS
jgi:hypothetical protein